MQTLTLSQPKTPEPIVTKFEWRDYIADVYHQEKFGLNPPRLNRLNIHPSCSKFTTLLWFLNSPTGCSLIIWLCDDKMGLYYFRDMVYTTRHVGVTLVSLCVWVRPTPSLLFVDMVIVIDQLHLQANRQDNRHAKYAKPNHSWFVVYLNCAYTQTSK